jgi:hypothetical protein
MKGDERTMANATMDMLLSQPQAVTGGRPFCAAKSQFAEARRRARQGQFWSSLTGQWRGLYALKQVRAVCAIEAESDAGVRSVPVGQIRGSEGRSRYFDRDFNPLHDEARGRWLSIARARQQGKHLPPVVLVQVGDVYFVRDGHHRVSVARALGQIDIEARITIWQVAGSVPWEALAQPARPGLADRLVGIGRTLKRLQREGARLPKRVAHGVRALLHAAGMAPGSSLVPRQGR